MKNNTLVNPIIKQNSETVKQRRQLALFMEKQKFSLLPLRPQGKQPYVELLPLDNDSNASWNLYGLRRASQIEIKAWFLANPEINYGILTGPPSGGLYVLDVDQPRKLPKNEPGKELPPTVTIKTGRGFHYYFKCNEELPNRKYAFGELKGAGGYVVGPGSQHENGTVYSFCDFLSLADVSIADLPSWLESPAQAAKPVTAELKAPSIPKPEKHKTKNGVRNNTVTCSISFRQLEALNQDPETAFKIMQLCGRDVNRIGKKFLCPLPGHEERKPSAALWQEPGRPVILNDFHERETTDPYTGEVRGGQFSWPLVDVYASCKVGKLLKLRKGERAAWWLRALHEIGAVNPPVLRGYDLPGDAKKPVQKLYKGFIYLMELRQLYEPQDSAPFSWTFAGQWCGLKSASQVQKAMLYLLERGYLFMRQPGVKIGEGEGPRAALFSIGRPR